MNIRTAIVLLTGIALGGGGASVAFLARHGNDTPSLYTNANGADVLRHPSAHIAAAVQYRGTVLRARPLRDGMLVAMRIDHTLIAAHVYDPTWTPAYPGQPLEIQGHVRGALGDPIDAAEVPVQAPLRRGETLIDVAAAIGPHRTRLADRPTSSRRARPHQAGR